MRPRGIPSRWVKLTPWYYTTRRQPTRAAEMGDAMRGQDYSPNGLVPIRRETVGVLLLNHAGELAGDRVDPDLAELAYEYQQATGWTVEQEKT